MGYYCVTSRHGFPLFQIFHKKINKALFGSLIQTEKKLFLWCNTNLQKLEKSLSPMNFALHGQMNNANYKRISYKKIFKLPVIAKIDFSLAYWLTWERRWFLFLGGKLYCLHCWLGTFSLPDTYTNIHWPREKFILGGCNLFGRATGTQG